MVDMKVKDVMNIIEH